MADQKRFNGVVSFNNRAHFAGNKADLVQGAGWTVPTPAVQHSIERRGDLIETTLLIDLSGLKSAGAGKVIGDDESTDLPSYFYQWNNEVNGAWVTGQLQCVETPAGGDTDIDMYANTAATLKYDSAAAGTHLFDVGTSAVTAFSNSRNPAGDDLDNQYLYLVSVGSTSAEYTAGKFLIKFVGQAEGTVA